MYAIIKHLLLSSLLVSCSITGESRYRDTESLERPPTVVNSSPSKEQRAVDDSSIPRKNDNAGLGSNVYQNSAQQLTIKQPFAEAWKTLSRALRLSGIKVTDHERDKGLFYITQETKETSGFFGKASSFFSDDEAIYLLTVKQEGTETTVTATAANAAEQTSTAKDGAQPPSSEGAGDLLQLLFKTLRDKLEEE